VAASQNDDVCESDELGELEDVEIDPGDSLGHGPPVGGDVGDGDGDSDEECVRDGDESDDPDYVEQPGTEDEDEDMESDITGVSLGNSDREDPESPEAKKDEV